MFTFQWQVAKEGYEWIRTRGLSAAFLSPKGERVKIQERWEAPLHYIMNTREEVKTKSITPLEHTGLFRTFADMAPTPEGIKAFANTYGLLWENERPSALFRHASMPRYVHWVTNILLLRTAVILWELGHHGDTESLAAFVHWRESSNVWIDTHPHCSERPQSMSLFGDMPIRAYPFFLAVGMMSHCHGEDGEAIIPRVKILSSQIVQMPTPHGALEALQTSFTAEEPLDALNAPVALHVRKHFEPALATKFRPGDLIQPALTYVRELVEQVLTDALSLRMAGPPAAESLALQLTPPALLEALWLQFALAIDGEKDYRRCPECPNWFELSPSIARADRLFCSNACRTRAYRRRIATAKQLYAEEASLETIARELGVDQETVQGWRGRGWR